MNATNAPTWPQATKRERRVGALKRVVQSCAYEAANAFHMKTNT